MDFSWPLAWYRQKPMLRKVKEHVILSVQNMTCSGCETKLSRSLSSIPSVKNVQASLLLSRAEFDVNTSVISIDGLIAQIKRLTGFSAEVMTGDEHEIEVHVTGDPKIFIGQILPAGVLDVTVVDKDIVRIRYDVQVTGARDLLERGFDNPLQIAPVRPHPSIAAGIKHVRHIGLMTLLSVLLTIPVLVLAWAPLPRHELIYGSVSLALATIIQVFIAGPFYPSALKSLIFARVIEMDLLIVMSTSAAYIFSVVAFGYLASGNPLSTGEFFETSTLLVSLIMVRRFVCALARQKAIESISIRSLQDYTAILVTDAGEKKIDARLLQYGDIFKVAPDTRIATDGTVIAGVTETDESMMTGETKLIEKKVGSSVVAGSVNGSGSIEVRVTRLLGNNTISTIANMVDEAKLSKPRIQDIADRVAGYFVPVILALAVLTFSIWVGLGIELRGQSGSEAVIQAITYAIAVLIVSCPCAIGLAVPMVIVIAGGVAADHGVIFKTADAIEIARKFSYVVFDKTGTLTQGRLSVMVEDYLKETEDSIVGLLLGLISDIKHPVSVAVASHLKAGGTRPGTLDRIEALVGKGVEGWLQDTVIRAGNSRWLGFEAHPQVQSLLSRGLTVFCVAINDDLRAVYGLEDTLRPDAKAVVSALVFRGISVSIVSGDDDGAVQAVASVVGIEPCNAKSRYTPANKQAYIKALTEKGDSNRGSNRSSRNSSVVLFCGDGTNDAVALAQATVGIHMNEGGTDIAQGAADVVLVRPALTGILTLVDLSRAACLRIVFNFSWAFTYNLFAVLLAAGAFVNVRIPPQYAGLGELVSVLPVIAIALQLRYFKPRAL
jgi:Cu2+-exporting ATPase